MILDLLSNAHLYYNQGLLFKKAFEYLATTDFSTVEKGKYELDGSNLFAIVNEYDTIPAAGEQMESHKKYIDIQYIVTGAERIGHALLESQIPSQAYDEEKDFMLFGEAPAFYSTIKAGMFAVFFPHDLHMPNLQLETAAFVKKVVIKVAVG